MRQVDARITTVRAALDRLSVELALVANAFVRARGWFAFGFARMDDHARERFGRSGRWLRDMAALGAALERLPYLELAMTGADGGRPLGRVAALLIARVATRATLQAWVARARAISIRQLRSELRALGATDDRPVGVMRLQVPRDVRAAFEEGFDLYRAVEGAEAPLESFIEALVAEAAASGNEGGSSDPTEADTPLFTEPRADVLLTEAAASAPGSRRVECADSALLDQEICSLLSIENELERWLAMLLREIAEMGAVPARGIAAIAEYGEERLGLSARTVRLRCFARRRLLALPVIRQAYEAGEIGLEAALHLIRIADGAPVDPETQREWVAHARQCTIKRLRDEARVVLSLGRLTPLSDAEWHASLRRERGRTRERLSAICARATEATVADVFLHFRLPREAIERFVRAIDAARRAVALAAASGTGDSGAVGVARRFRERRRRLPRWVGLLALLEEFACVWDTGAPRRSERVYARDGWRCAAPGCTSRRNLELHHIRYESRGGDDSDENRICLCRFHHQRGEHGGLALCRGRAPLEILWRLGREEVAVWYRNERRLSA